MKEKILNFSVDTDVNSIECDLYCAHLILAAASDGKLIVEYPDCKNVNAGCGDGTLIVNQQKRRLFAHKKQTIKIYVPEHTVPALKISGRHLAVEITDGIYGELAITADDGDVSLSGGSFGEAEITGGDVSVYLSGVTVKGGLIIKIARG
ncbi:MAG: DUF4097 domain-containing protein, partial [Clostridia bacterium]|nr:DUF4097 domain-containing protein [Clostridia bacterium]